MKIKVEYMTRPSGSVAPQQIIIHIGNVSYLQSYDSIIARRRADGITLDVTYWRYSRTTGIYRNQFLGEGIRETRRKIEQGIYKLEDLNS